MDISSWLDEARDWNNLYVDEIFVFKFSHTSWMCIRMYRIRMEETVSEIFRASDVSK